ncbi:FANCI helical domain-containing protein [Caenorhabditis elegans]|uniref:FANCI helical domain-containing protein n=1 Tax=Caenorhabditis elegans TaxID=6239 RepID=Q7Z151_CAEEL|nr:FANCI helical domain-containing protein [Caenorhabditis elegans]CCD68993.1 FANCI helical domain-containing protein [Caenorhabditis elegans]|eukprot:NP_001021652.1 FANCI (Fanconi anemia complex component I) homolog [Caenorhabditis elegans]
MSQAFTQTSQPRRGGGTEKFVDALIKFRQKHPDNLNSVSETSKNAVITNLGILNNDNKWSSLERLLVQMCSDDRGGRMFEFTHSIFTLLSILPNPTDAENLSIRTIKFLLNTLTKATVSVPNFFGMYNDLMVQVENISNYGLTQLVDYVSIMLKRANEWKDQAEGEADDTENVARGKNNNSKMSFNQRWKDFVAVFIKKVRDIDQIELDDELLPGSDAADNILFEWLKTTEDVDAFELISEISASSSSGITTPSIDRFCDEVIVEKIGIDTSSDDMDSERKRRSIMTWKSLILTTKTEKERLGRLWNGIICAWEISEDEEKEKMEQRKISEHLEKCLTVGHRILNINVESAKKFLTFIRTDKYRVLSSEFGLCLCLIQCCLDRNDAMMDMKKTFQKLWKIGEQAEECLWMSDIVCGRIIRLVDLQLRIISENLHSNENLRRILSRPLISLMLSLLDTPAYQKQVVVVDGRVADGCTLWLLSRDILIIVSQADVDMGAQLSHLFKSIASSSNNSSALILIDVLRELVRKCSVEILNNSKLIDGLFDYVCRMRKDIAVSLIRCLIPIINTRPQLRNALFKSLKKDLLCESTVGSAVPIVLILLRSVSKRREDGGGGQFDHSMSQSFGTFSTQTLNSMGLKKNVDQTVGLELVGIIKRCLWQPVKTKIALYDGICELATQTSTMLNQFLDMILSHARMIPEWKKSEMTVSIGNIVQIVEPIPHLIQTMECLMSELLSHDPEFKLEGTELLLRPAANQMEIWVTTAMRNDVSDMGLDKNIEWTTATVNGRCSLLFAQMMLSTYDVLIEHMWRRVETTESKEDADKIVALLARRSELDILYKEKTTTKKEKDKEKEKEEKITIDSSQSEILTSAKTLSSIMTKLIKPAENDGNSTANATINVRPEIVADVQMELLVWVVGRAKVLSSALVKEYRPLHSILSGTSSLISLSKSLIDLYMGNNCSSWVSEIDTGSPTRTLAIESYANILQFLSIKFKQTPTRLTSAWFEEKDGEDEETKRKRQEPNIVALRQAHFLSCRLFRQIIDVENEEIEEEKKPKAQYEMQGRAILKAASAALSLTKNVKVWSNLFTRVVKVLEDETFYNNQMLRDYCKFIITCSLRCADSDKTTAIEMHEIMENILEFLSEENEEMKYHFISKTTINVSIEFQFMFVEKTLALIRDAFTFQKDFFVKPPVFDNMLCTLLTKCLEVTELVSRILQIFVQYKMMQERVTEIMTSYFTTIQMGVVLLQNLTKGWGKEMSEWQSTNILATLVKTKLRPILAMVDDHIGFSKGKDEMKKKISQKTRYAKSKRDEKLFSKFSHEREAVQHGILVLCKLIKDDRFDLQIKNNSIGYRDFRIDMEVLRNKLSGQANEEVCEPATKRGRRDPSMEDEEIEETEESTTSARRSSEEPEEPRDQENTVGVVKQEVDDEEESVSRGTSPVF